MRQYQPPYAGAFVGEVVRVVLDPHPNPVLLPAYYRWVLGPYCGEWRYICDEDEKVRAEAQWVAGALGVTFAHLGVKSQT